MNNNNDIQDTIDQILAELKEEGMTESSIKSGYLSVYKSFLKFLDENDINEVTEEVCLQYIEIKNQIRLPSLLTVTSNDSLNRRIRALVILLRYQKTGSLDLSTRGKKVPFSCPIALASAYEAFATETEKSHLAADTKSTIINSTQRFILSVSEDGLADWGLLDMSYIDLFLSKYKDSQLKYRGTLIYGLKKFLHFLSIMAFVRSIIQKISCLFVFLEMVMFPTLGHLMSLKDFSRRLTANRPVEKETMLFFLSVFRPDSGQPISEILKSTILTGKHIL